MRSARSSSRYRGAAGTGTPFAELPDSIAKLTEGMNDRERTDALAALAQRLSYGPGAADLKWPSDVLPPRTILSGERKKNAAKAEGDK